MLDQGAGWGFQSQHASRGEGDRAAEAAGSHGQSSGDDRALEQPLRHGGDKMKSRKYPIKPKKAEKGWGEGREQKCRYNTERTNSKAVNLNPPYK